MWTNEQHQLMFQRMREVHIKVEILNHLDMPIDEVQGFAIGGSIGIDNTTLIRRSLDLKFVSDSKFDINEKGVLWINKRLRLWIGIRDFFDKVHWFNQGIFVIDNPQEDIGSDGESVTIKAFDKMHLFEEQVDSDIKIDAGTPLHEAVKAVGELAGETKFLIEASEFDVPYDLQFDVTTSKTEIMNKLIELYSYNQVYYNLDGFLVFEQYKSRVDDPFIWEFKGDADFRVSNSIAFDYSNVKNRIKVLGKMDEETALQPEYEIKIEGSKDKFSIDNIGEKILIIRDDTYTNEEQCKNRCKKEIEDHQNLATSFNISTIPIYLINDVNKIIKVMYKEDEIVCMVDKVDIPLLYDGLMSIQCHQLYL